MQKVIITRGLPSSGKTTWAYQHIQKHREFVRINKDDLRSMLYGDAWTVKQERFILAARDGLLCHYLLNGKSVIIDDTNFHPKHIAKIKELAAHCESQLNFPDGGKRIVVEVKDFEIDVEEAIKRDLKRARSVGERVIRQMYNQYVKPPTPKIEYVAGLSAAVICDLDGTLSLLNGRDPYNASTADQDLINYPVLRAVTDYYDGGTKLIFVSGREDKYLEPTVKFLEEKCGIYTYNLFMRKTGDSRKDSIVKEEIYRKYIENKYNVAVVFDDRNQVVDMWRSLGLTVFQVADGDF